MLCGGVLVHLSHQTSETMRQDLISQPAPHLDTGAIRYPVGIVLVVLALLRLALHLEAPLQDPRNDVVVTAATAFERQMIREGNLSDPQIV